MKWAKNRYFGCGYTLHDLSNCRAKVLEARKLSHISLQFLKKIVIKLSISQRKE
jgi:hypothetical protein